MAIPLEEFVKNPPARKAEVCDTCGEELAPGEPIPPFRAEPSKLEKKEG
jgi:hypothetical protein